MTAVVTDALQNWRTLRVGAGGWLTGFDQHADGTLVCRCDTYGGWIYKPETSDWAQLVTTDSMPAADQRIDNQDGIYEIAIAPSNSSRFWMAYNRKVYKSDNKGANWTLATGTGYPAITYLPANDGRQRMNGPKLAIDPLDEDIVYLGTMDDGLLRTLDGGTNWGVLTDVPVGTGTAGANDPGVTGIIFDPTSAAISGRTATLWASSHGNGYYLSIDGGDSWAKPTGGPATSVERPCFTTTGVLWCFDKAGANLYRYMSGAWAAITASATSQGGHTIACDPFDANRVILATEGGILQESVNASDATPTFTSLAFGVVSTESSADIPWLENGYFNYVGSPYMSNGDMRFHPTTQNKLMFSEGIGFWTTTLSPGFTTISWTSMSKGIEQLVANHICATDNGKLHLAAWDRPVWTITNPETYQSAYFLKDTQIDNCNAINYSVADPNVACAVGQRQSGKTLNGGSDWTEFATYPTWGSGQGEIALGSATNFVWCPASKRQPAFTTDGGDTWALITRPAEILDDTSDDGWGGFNNGQFLTKHILAADGVTANKFYLYNYLKGVFVSTDSGNNWTLDYSGRLIPTSGFNDKFKSVPGKAGHLWCTAGPYSVGNPITDYATPVGAFKRSVDAGVTWSTISDVLEVYDFGFGTAASGASYPTLYIIGFVNSVFGIYYSTDVSDTPGALSWTKISDGFPLNSLDQLTSIDAHKQRFGEVYIGFKGSGLAYSDGAANGYKRFRLINS